MAYPIGKMKHFLVTGLMVALGSGCTVFPERNGAPQQWRLLAPEMSDAPTETAERVIVRLVETRAASAIDRRDMAYSRGRQSLAYYRDSRWASPPGVMLNEIIDETLSTQPWVRTVVRGGARVPAELSLYCEIQRLEHLLEPASEDVREGKVRLKVACSWYRAAERQLVEATVFDETTELDADNAEGYATGAQRLVDDLMSRLVEQGARLAGQLAADAEVVPAAD